MADIRIPNGILTIAGEYKPGDLPPEGYLEWQEWALVQSKAGIKQVTCGQCGGWKTPQELSGQFRDYRAFKITNRGREYITTKEPICTKCNNKKEPS